MKIKYEIENNSYEVVNPKFSIEKKDNIFLGNINKSKIPLMINETFDSELKKSKKNSKRRYFTYHKTYNNRDTRKTFKIITQKRDDSTISSIKKSDNSFINDTNLFNSCNDKNDKKDSNNNYINNIKDIDISKSNDNNGKKEKDNNNINNIENMKLLESINDNNDEIRDENEFMNSINKSTTLKINLHYLDDNKYNNKLTSYDDRGFIYNSNASYYDNDGVYFDENGYDKNKGRHDRLGEYQPGPDFNEELGMYNNDINNLSFDKEKLKKEVEEKDEIEFQKIKMEGKESKKLQKDFQLPIEKDDSSDDLDIDEEYNMLDKSSDSEISFKQPENSNTKSNNSNDNMINKFFNGELNEEMEKHLKEEEEDEEEKEIQQNLEEIETIKNETENELNILKDLKSINNNYKIKTKKLNSQKVKRKSKPNNHNHKSKVIEKEDNLVNESINTKENKSQKINKNQSINKILLKKFPDITEDSLNNEKNFEDIDSYIKLKKIISLYSTTDAEKEDTIQELNNLVMNFKKNLFNE